MKQYPDNNASYLAPLVVPLFMSIILLFTGTAFFSIVFVALFSAIISYAGFAVFILPVHKHLKAKQKESLLPLLLSGLIGGALIMAVLYYLLGQILGSRDNFQYHIPIIGAVFGGLVAFVYCVISGSHGVSIKKTTNHNR